MAQPYAPLLQQMLSEFQSQRHDAAERIAQSILRINPKDLIALQVLGLVLAMQGRVLEAIDPLSKAALQDSKNPELLSNLARAQYGAGLFQDAIGTFEKLNRIVPNNAQILMDKGTAHAKLRQYDQATLCYDKVIELSPDYFLVWSNRGNLLSDLGFTGKAIESYETALKLNPNYPETWTNYGNAFFDLGRYEDARLAHEKALSLDPNYGEAWSNHANALLELKRNDEALVSYQKAYSLVPGHPFLIGQLVDGYGNLCDWANRDLLVPKLLDSASKMEPASPPFIMLQTSATLELQKQAAEIFTKIRIPAFNNSFPKLRARSGDQKIRIGYFSSDFKTHPVGMLMENILKLHDRSRFEIYGFFLNKRVGDPVEHRLTELFDKSIDLFGLNDFEAYELSISQDLDIAIDLNGHTAAARTKLFSRKIAPIQMNYLGYAGTSGSDFYQYLIADKIAIPPEHQSYYSEKIAYLPNSFFPADTLISREEFGDMPTRASQGLPESGFIFACFNNAYKITPDIFDIWMKLLKDVPDSVLWLSRPSEKAIENLQKEVTARGVDPSRIIFAIRVPARKDHLSRLRLADLFLDTSHFNAHTTAADALWAGVPVLSILGNTFASRVASSMLTALGMNEMIVNSKEEYYNKAFDLASHPDKISQVKAKQESNRLTTALFDTKQYVKDLEDLYLSAVTKSH
ncbi:glycosyltransferase family 41 protein [Polynucleobacter sp. AP-Kolm-20A-A1]|uniref:O-linked N-acetylglucosamine transferase, SPINDLY family protein n=1 Tax=Polynucleobacter sp. AP-Kolm-20A-A1 TaxID=2081041 RepID=UPI001BFE65C3|nr:glycosyltransferase family 41 protein [Polynucleobacter sp. AP-Kolm-20A-A1]QWE19823.1 tetratricopeptide repeat protein [Polynucleobacter sp. AP-Kolm-20A-A1]